LLGEMAGAEEEQAMQDLKGDLSSLRDVSAELRGSVASEQQAAQRLSEQLLDEKYLDIDKRYRSAPGGGGEGTRYASQRSTLPRTNGLAPALPPRRFHQLNGV